MLLMTCFPWFIFYLEFSRWHLDPRTSHKFLTYNWVLMKMTLSSPVQYWLIKRHNTEFIHEWMAWCRIELNRINQRSKCKMWWENELTKWNNIFKSNYHSGIWTGAKKVNLLFCMFCWQPFYFLHLWEPKIRIPQFSVTKMHEILSSFSVKISS